MHNLYQLTSDFTLPKSTKELRHRYRLDIATRHEDYDAERDYFEQLDHYHAWQRR
jgi:hypothetical protein